MRNQLVTITKRNLHILTSFVVTYSSSDMNLTIERPILKTSLVNQSKNVLVKNKGKARS